MAALIQHNHMFTNLPWDKRSEKKPPEISSAFHLYNSIDNHDNKKIQQFLKLPEANLHHIVREKIDGSAGEKVSPNQVNCLEDMIKFITMLIIV
jgi:hypothetical protein